MRKILKHNFRCQYMTTLDNEILLPLCPKFYCETCDYKTCKKSSFVSHLNSIKHSQSAKTTLDNEIKPKLCSKKYSCDNCEKNYNDRAGLWRHKKRCLKKEIDISNKEIKEKSIDDKDLIMMLVKQNAELLEVIKNGTHNMTNSHNHSHNKTFNLQFFLNETCKDAMNIMDFVDSIKFKLTDLEKMGEVGYVEGLSNIITNNLKALDVTQRPIHCTDKKREVLYIKDDNTWSKEDDDKKKMRKVIKKVAHKNSTLLNEFREKYPDCNKSNSLYSDQYNKMIIEAMGGLGNNDCEKEDKIIRNISKNVIIDKEKN